MAKIQPKWLDYSDIQLVSKMIRTNLKNQDYQKLESSIYAGFKKLPKTRYYNHLLLKSILTLVDYHISKKQFYECLILLERARQSFPKNRKIIRNEINLLESIFNLHYSTFVLRDLLLLKTIFSLLLHSYSKGFPSEKTVLLDLINTVEKLLENPKKDAESKNTFYLEEFLLNLYGDLSKEDQVEEFTKIIIPEILRWLAENQNDDSDEDEESDGDEN